MAAATATNAAKTAKKILMVRPTYFDVKYSINPWMDPRNPVNVDKAHDQWATLKKTIEAAGAVVEVMEPNGADQYPDMVFSANAAVLRNNKAYLANFFYPERKGEQFFYNKWFKENGYETYLSHEIAFEGAGDALWAGKNQSKLFCGVGPRTDVRALYEIADKLRSDEPFKIFGLRLVDPRFYHIDTCLCPLNADIALWYKYAFDHVAQFNLRNEIDLIPVSEKDASRFACNAVVVDQTVILNEGAEETARNLERVGYKPVFVQMSEFIKSGGSAKCCTLALNE
uniref:Amidinotransferase n=1 Tax=Panagrellus redivivus TaxID=6233 RepID=A0A7E4VGR5_PANRE